MSSSALHRYELTSAWEDLEINMAETAKNGKDTKANHRVTERSEPKRRPQELLPFDLSGYQLSEFASFLKANAPEWVARGRDGARVVKT